MNTQLKLIPITTIAIAIAILTSCTNEKYQVLPNIIIILVDDMG